MSAKNYFPNFLKLIASQQDRLHSTKEELDHMRWWTHVKQPRSANGSNGKDTEPPTDTPEASGFSTDTTCEPEVTAIDKGRGVGLLK